MSYDRREDGLRSDGSKGHVLIADDAPFITKQLEKIFTEEGYNIIGIVHDGEAALNTYKEKYPDIDLVSLDVTMPKMDGISTLEQILAFDKDAHVVMITSYNSSAMVKRALMIGAKNVIMKPIQTEKAIPRINASVRK